MSFTRDYLGDVKVLIDKLSEDQIELFVNDILTVWKHKRKLIFMGNGGSSATASHIVNDFQKCLQLDTGVAVKAMCLSDNTPLAFAWANDTEFANVYTPQIECWVEPGDLVVGISGSGNSPNILNAIEAANKLGALTYGLAGFDGGKLADIAQRVFVVESDSMQRIEDLHMIILHLAFAEVRRRANIVA